MATLKAPFPWVWGMTTEDRFWAKVRKTKGCWLWTASCRYRGYGAFAYTVRGRLVNDRAHRYSYRIGRGPIPRGMMVLHKCDNPACVNPRHLFLGTNQDNVDDMMRKGRHVKGGTYSSVGYERGENHHNAKLTEAQVLEIREARRYGESYESISKRYGVRAVCIFKIVKGIAWKHV